MGAFGVGKDGIGEDAFARRAAAEAVDAAFVVDGVSEFYFEVGFAHLFECFEGGV